MFIRYKLQIFFLGLALLALSSFGIVAYDSSLKVRIQQEISILKNFSEYILNDIARHANTAEQLQSYIDNQEFLPENYLLIVKKDNNFFLPRKQKGNLKSSFFVRLFSNKNINGFTEVNGNKFTWIKSSFKNYKALLIHKLPNDTLVQFFYSIGLPLIITGFIIMWLVFWASVLLNSLINKLKEKNISMQHMVMHDALTSLPNRYFLHDKIEDTIKIAKKELSTFAVIIVDLRRFKEINDTLGHHFGDALLIAISDLLQSELDSPYTPARFSGDKFAILVPNINQNNISNIIEHIQNIFCRSFELGDHKIYIDATMGVAFFPEHGINSAILTQRAEMTMSIAKKASALYSVYDPETDTTSLENLKINNSLRKAISNKSFELYYQPQIKYSNQECTHFEALIRWHHAKHGSIPPDQFIPLAEKMGLIQSISNWVMESAIKQCSEWHTAGFEFTVAINLSAWDIQETDLPIRLQSLLNKYLLPSENLIVEVTETGITSNIKQASKILNQIHDLGIKIALDDFGTGFSSLHHLRRFPISEVKIDRMFISSMNENSDDLALVKAIIDLSHDLKIDVVAEGVETIQEVNTLNNYCCDRLQGYYYSKALAVKDIIPFATNEQQTKQNSSS